jgi:hypothetical protein
MMGQASTSCVALCDAPQLHCWKTCNCDLLRVFIPLHYAQLQPSTTAQLTHIRMGCGAKGGSLSGGCIIGVVRACMS